MIFISRCNIRPCVEYCFQAWTTPPSCYLEMLQVSSTFGPSLAGSLEHLAHRRNVSSLSLFYRYYFGRCSSDLAQLVLLPYSRGSPLVILVRCMIFLPLFSDVKDVYVSSFFPRTASLWNPMPTERFPLTYDLNGLKCRAKRHLLSLSFF